LPVYSSERIAENMWLAARDGLHGSLIAETGDRRRTSTHLCALAAHLLPAATELGCSEELLGIERMVREGVERPANAKKRGPMVSTVCVTGSQTRRSNGSRSRLTRPYV